MRTLDSYAAESGAIRSAHRRKSGHSPHDDAAPATSA